MARCSLTRRPQAAFPSVPVNPFWSNTHPHTCRGGACCTRLGAQCGNTRMKWFVCGTLHEEDPQPATCLVCPQDSGDAPPLPPAPDLTLSGSPGPVTQSPSSPFPASRTSGSCSTSHRVTCGYSRQARGAMCQGPAGMPCSHPRGQGAPPRLSPGEGTHNRPQAIRGLLPPTRAAVGQGVCTPSLGEKSL